MPINRSLWLEPFSPDNIPDWPCPTCGTGFLRLTTNGFHTIPDSDSVQTSNPEDFDYESAVFRFAAILQCNNSACREGVVCVGVGTVESDHVLENNRVLRIDRKEVFVPRFFYPRLSFFGVPRKLPLKVRHQIAASFRLFFADPSAAANHVRNAVDAILTDRGSRKIIVVNHRERRLALHDRIVAFEKHQPETAKKLLAIKWIGNEGAHHGLRPDDVLDAYEILEAVIDDLYVGYRKEIEKKVSIINKKKKPLGRQRV